MRRFGFRFGRRLWCTVLGGAVAALGPGGTAWAVALDAEPAPPAAMEIVDEFADSPGHCWDLEAYAPVGEEASPAISDCRHESGDWEEYSCESGESYADEYGYDEMYGDETAADESVVEVDEAIDESSEWTYEDDYSYESGESYADEYGYDEMCGDETVAEETVVDVEEADDSSEWTYEDDYSYESGESYVDEYGYDEMYADETAADESVVEVDEADDSNEWTYEDDYSYESGESYVDEYGYDQMYGEEAASDETVAEETLAEVDKAIDDSGEWTYDDEYWYEDEYSYEYGESAEDEADSETAPVEVAAEDCASDVDTAEAEIPAEHETVSNESADDASDDCCHEAYDYADYESMYGYGYDSGAAMEDVETVEESQPVDEAIESTDADESDHAYDWAYEYGECYGYPCPAVESQEAVSGPGETAESTTEIVEDNSGLEEFSEYDYDEYFGYDGAAMVDESDAGADESSAEAVEDLSGVEDVSEYEAAEWDEPYGYPHAIDETDCESSDVPEAPATEDAQDESPDPLVEYESWNGYRYEYYYPANEASEMVSDSTDAVFESETADAAEPAAESEASEVSENESPEPSCSMEEDWSSEYGYDYGMEAAAVEESHGSSEEIVSEDDFIRYDYADPYAYYGDDFEGYARQQPQAEGAADETAPFEVAQPSAIELFTWTPAELLSWSDQELLRNLATLSEEPAAVRRAALNDYLASLGSDATDFASQFEDTTGIEVAGFADDLPGTAALLASYRLIERGEIGTGEAVELLRRSLQDLSPAWIEGVRAMTAESFSGSAEPCDCVAEGDAEPAGNDEISPVVNAMISLATRSLAGVGGAVLDFSQAIVGTDWEGMLLDSAGEKAASLPAVESDSYQR